MAGSGRGRRAFIPLRVNSAGVMPIIFAQSFIVVPGTAAAFMDLGPLSTLAEIFQPKTMTYYVTYGLLIRLLHVLLHGDHLQSGRPGGEPEEAGCIHPRREAGCTDGGVHRSRSDARDAARLDLPGDHRAGAVLDLSTYFGIQTFFFGGTSLLIVVGVGLDTVQQAQQLLLLRHYDGFMKKGRVKMRGRQRYM